MRRFDFGEDQFNRLFPFYVIFTPQGKIVSTGCSFSKTFGNHTGGYVADILEIYRPNTPGTSWSNITDTAPDLVILKAIGSDILLRGQMERLTEDEVIFLGSPWFNDIDELTQHGLTMHDFATHDSTLDSLHLLKANELTKNDALKIADEQKKLKGELLTTVNRLSAVLISLDSGMLVETKERTIALVNQAFCNTFSIPVHPETMVGLDCSSSAEQTKHLFADPQQFVMRINEILADRVLVKDELVYMADGRVLSRTYMPISIDNKYEGHLWKYDDITIKFESQKTIARQKEFYEKILNEIPADIAIFSPDHKYLFINKVGIKNDEVREWIINKDDYDYCRYRGKDIAIADERRAKFNNVIDLKQSVSFVDEIVTPSGEIAYVLRIFYPYVAANGSMEFVIGYGIDVTQQKKHELQLQQQQQEQRELLEVMTDGIFRCDNDLNINFFNQAFMQLCGIEANGRTVNIYDIVDDGHHDELKQRLDALIQTDERQQAIVKLAKKRAADEDIYVDLVISNINNRYAKEHLIGGRISDITETVFRERNLEQHVREEKELNDLKTRFIRITSHELRTPLAVIMTNAELLEIIPHDADKSKSSKMLSRITKEVNRMTRILNELLLASKIEHGDIEFSPRPASIVTIVSDLKREFYDPYFDGRPLILDIAPGVDIWNFDEQLVQHILINLINNAFKYSPGKASPQLSVSVSNAQLIISVADHGIGIPQEEIKNLTRSFFRASNVGTVSGTGLGLMIVSYMVNLHKGTLHIDSKLNEGSVFTVTLPV